MATELKLLRLSRFMNACKQSRVKLVFMFYLYTFQFVQHLPVLYPQPPRGIWGYTSPKRFTNLAFLSLSEATL